MALVKSFLASALMALSVTLFAIPPLAQADVIYTYRGNDFTNVIGSTFITSDFVTVTLDYAQAPPPNAISTTTPIAWTFAAGSLSLSSTASPAPDLMNAYMDVSAGGAVKQWALEVVDFPTARGIETSNQNGIADDFAFDSPFVDNTGSNYQIPGTWTRTPPIVPEPSSFALLGAGLAGLFIWLPCVRRRLGRNDA